MWSAVKTTGIVLTSSPWKEADRWYSVITPELGLIEFIGRGAQKPKAKLASHLEPFAVVDLEIIKGIRSTTVIGVERREVFSHIQSSLEHRMFVQTLFAMLAKAIRPDFADPELFDDILGLVRFLNNQPSLQNTRSAFVLGATILRLLARLGYGVELHECLSCRLTVVPLAFRWHGGKGGLVCSDCVQKFPEEWFAARGMEPEIVTLMRLGRDASLESLMKFPLKGDHVESFIQCVHDVYVYHVPGETLMPFWIGVLAVPALA